MYAWRTNLYLLYTINAYVNISIYKYVYILVLHILQRPIIVQIVKGSPVNPEFPGGNVTADGSMQKQAK